MILTENGVLKLMQRIKSFIASQLNTKAASVHTHSISEIDDLASQLGGGYSKSEVDTLLNGKADTSHTHTTSDITDFPSLATVATSGSYSDLSNKPTIPTVNNGTLTIQQNSTTVDTFTANSSTDKTVNIQCVDLSNNQTVGGVKTFSNAPVVSSINLDGKTIDTDASGNMTYDGHIVDIIEEQGDGYIRYSNGLQICWGVIIGDEFEPFNGHYGKLISYPKSFLAHTEPIINISQWRGTGDLTQNFNIYIVSESYVGIETDNGWGVYYTVFGRWK